MSLMDQRVQGVQKGAPGPASGRLNEFQRTMLQWSQLHPYNAVHVARVRPALDPENYVRAAAQVLRLAGLLGYEVDAGRGTYRYSGESVELAAEVIEGGADPMATLQGEVQRWLNEAFPASGGFQPFRFFLVQAQGESFAGLAYYHVAADADSVGRLLTEVIALAFDETCPGLRDPSLARRRPSRMPPSSPWVWAKKILASFQKFQQMRRSFRSPDCPSNEFQNCWFGHSLTEEESAAALARAKGWGATLNDLCLAALLKAVVPETGERFEKNRQHLSAGCVVNLRRDLPESRQRDFGLYLGSFSVTHPVPPDIPLETLVADVRRLTGEIKREKLYLASALEFRVNRFLFARQSLEKQRNFYRKAYPVWGSITNFKMREIHGEPHWRVTDYYRGVSTGPALPFVIGVTGYGGRLHFGFSYRPNVISAECLHGIADRFLALLTGKGAAS